MRILAGGHRLWSQALQLDALIPGELMVVLEKEYTWLCHNFSGLSRIARQVGVWFYIWQQLEYTMKGQRAKMQYQAGLL